MKRYITVLSLALVFAALATACGKSEMGSVVDHPNTDVPVSHSTTAPEYTVGKESTSMKTETGKHAYEINYFDDNGLAVKKELYENNKLVYYIEVSGTDENGNGTQEKYYAPDGTLFGVFDGGFFYDGNGTQISEDVMEANLYKVTNQK